MNDVGVMINVGGNASGIISQLKLVGTGANDLSTNFVKVSQTVATNMDAAAARIDNLGQRIAQTQEKLAAASALKAGLTPQVALLEQQVLDLTTQRIAKAVELKGAEQAVTDAKKLQADAARTAATMQTQGDREVAAAQAAVVAATKAETVAQTEYSAVTEKQRLLQQQLLAAVDAARGADEKANQQTQQQIDAKNRVIRLLEDEARALARVQTATAGVDSAQSKATAGQLATAEAAVAAATRAETAALAENNAAAEKQRLLIVQLQQARGAARDVDEKSNQVTQQHISLSTRVLQLQEDELRALARLQAATDAVNNSGSQSASAQLAALQKLSNAEYAYERVLQNRQATEARLEAADDAAAAKNAASIAAASERVATLEAQQRAAADATAAAFMRLQEATAAVERTTQEYQATVAAGQVAAATQVAALERLDAAQFAYGRTISNRQEAEARLAAVENETQNKNAASIAAASERVITLENQQRVATDASAAAFVRLQEAQQRVINSELDYRDTVNAANVFVSGSARGAQQAVVDLAAAQANLTTKEAEQQKIDGDLSAAKGTLKTKSSELSAATREEQSSITGLVTLTDKYNAAVQQNATVTAKWAQADNEANSGLKNLAVGVKDAAAAILGFGRDTEAAGRSADGLLSIGTHLGGMFVRLKGDAIGIAAVGMGLQTVAQQGKTFLDAGVMDTAEFDRVLKVTSDILGGDLAKNMDSIRNLSLNLGRDTVFTNTEVAQTVNDLARSGVGLSDIYGKLSDAQKAALNPAQLKAASEGANGMAAAVLNLAAATGATLPEATKLAVTSMNIFAAENLTTAQQSNLLTAALNSAQISTTDLENTIKSAGANLAVFGVTMKDTLEATDFLGRLGITGSQAGTAMRYFWDNAIPKSTKALNVMQDLGLMTVNDAAATTQLSKAHEGLAATYEGTQSRLYDVWAGDHGVKGGIDKAKAGELSAFQQWELHTGVLSSKFFDAKGNAVGFGIAIGDLYTALKDLPAEAQVKTINDIFGARAGAQGAAEFMTVLQQIISQGGTVDDVLQQVDKDFSAMPDAAKIAQDRMEGLAGRVQYLQGSWASFVNVLNEPLQAPLIAFVNFIADSIVNPLTELLQKQPQLATMIGTVLGLVTAFAAVAGPMLLMSATLPFILAGLGGLIAMSPIIAVLLTGLAAVIVAIVHSFSDPNNGLNKALGDFATTFERVFLGAAVVAGNFFNIVILPLSRQLATLWTTTLLPALIAVGNWLGTNLPGIINGVVNFLLNSLLPVVASLAKFLAEQVPTAIALLGQAWNTVLLPALTFLWNLLVNQVLPAGEKVVTWLGETLPGVIAIAAQAWDTVLRPVLLWLWDELVNHLVPAFEGIVDWLKVQIPIAIHVLHDAWVDTLQPMFSTLLSLVLDHVVPAVEKLGAFLVSVLPKAFDIVHDAWFIALKPTLEWVVNFLTGPFVDAILKAGRYLSDHGEVVKLVVYTVLIPAFGAWAISAGAAAVATTVALAPIIPVLIILAGVTALLAKGWDNNFLGMRDTINVLGIIVHGVFDEIGKDANALGLVLAGIFHVFTLNFKQANLDFNAAFASLGRMAKDGILILQGIADIAGNNLKDAATKFAQATVDIARAGNEQTEADAKNHVSKMGETFSTMQQAIKATLGLQIQDNEYWGSKTVEQIAALAGPVKATSAEIGQTLRTALNTELDGSLADSKTWGDKTLGVITGMSNPAYEDTTNMGGRIVQALSAAFGISSTKLSNWKNLTLNDLISMATPAGSAMTATGTQLRDRLQAMLGLSNKDVDGFKKDTLDTWSSMIKPAGVTGTNIGYDYTGGIFNGMMANVPAIVGVVSFLRKQLGIAMAVEEAMGVVKRNGADVGIPNSVNDVDQFRAGKLTKVAQDKADAAQAQAISQGIPQFVLDLLAGPDPSVPDFSLGSLPSSPGGGTPPGNQGPDNKKPDNSGTPPNGQTPYQGSPSPAAADTSAKVSAAQTAADLALKVADAINQGIKALEGLSGLTIPSNIKQKAVEFANVVAEIVYDMQRVATQFNDKTLATTLSFVDVAAKSMDAIVKGVDAFAKLPLLVVPSRAAVTQFVALTRDVVALFTAAAAGFKIEAITQADLFADAAVKVFDVISKGIDAFIKLQDLVPPQASAIAKFMAGTKAVMDAFVPLAQSIAPEGRETASLFADAMAKVMDSLTKAVAFFDALEKMDGDMAVAQGRIGLLFSSAKAIMVTMLAIVRDNNGWNENNLATIGQFGDAVAKAVDALTKTADLLIKLNTPGVIWQDQTDKVALLAANAVAMAQSLVSAAASWPSSVATKVAAFADAVAKAVDSLTKTADLLIKLSTPGVIWQSQTQRVAELAQNATAMAQSLVSAANSWDSATTTKVAAFGDSVSKVADGLTKALTFFALLAHDHTDYAAAQAKAGELGSAAVALFGLFQPAGQQWDGLTAPAGAFGDAVTKVADSLSKAIDLFQKLDANTTDFSGMRDTITALRNAVVDMMDQLGPVAVPFAGFTAPLVEFADAAGKVADSLGKTFDLFDKFTGTTVVFGDQSEKIAALVAGVKAIMDAFSAVTPQDYQARGVDTFADVAAKIADSLGKAFDLFDKMAVRFRIPDQDKLLALASGVVGIVRAFEAALTLAGVELNAAQTKTNTFVTSMADVVGKVADGLLKAIDLFIKLGDSAAYLGRRSPQALISPLLDLILGLVQQFSGLRAQLAQVLDKDIANLAGDLGNVVDGLVKAVDLFAKLDTYKHIGTGRIDSFAADVRQLIARIPAIADELAPEMLDAAQEFGNKVGPAIDVLSKAVALFQVLGGQDTTSTTTKGTTSKTKSGLLDINPAAITELAHDLQLLLAAMRTELLDKFAPDFLDFANEFATKIGPAVDVLSKALDLFMTLGGIDSTSTNAKGKTSTKDKGGLLPIDPDAIGALVGDLYILLHHWDNLIKGGEFQGDFLERSQRFADTVGSIIQVINLVVQLVKDVGALTTGITVGTGGHGHITAPHTVAGSSNLFDGLLSIMQGLIAAMQMLSDAPAQAALAGAQAFADTLAAVLQAISDAVATSGKVGDISPLVGGLKNILKDLSQLLQDQANPETTNTVMYWWNGAKGLLTLMLEAVDGTKKSLRPFLRLAFQGLMSDIDNDVETGGQTILLGWHGLLNQMKDAAVAAVAAIIATMKTISSGTITFTFTTSVNPTGQGNGNNGNPNGGGGDGGGGGGGGGSKGGGGGGGGGARTLAVTNNYHIREIKVNKLTDFREQTTRQYRLANDPA